MKGKTKTILAIVLAVAIVAVAAVGTVTFLKDNGEAAAAEEENTRTLPVAGSDEGTNSGNQGNVPENLNEGENTPEANNPDAQPNGETLTPGTAENGTNPTGTPGTTGTNTPAETRTPAGTGRTGTTGTTPAEAPAEPEATTIEQERLVSQTLNWSNISLDANIGDRNVNYTNLKYTVNYYQVDENEEKLLNTETDKAEFGTTVTVSDEDIEVNCPVGYMLDEESIVSLEITANEAKNVINVYYVKDDSQVKDITYTVKHYIEDEYQEKDDFEETVSVWVNDETAPVSYKVDENKYVGYKLSESNVKTEAKDGEVFTVKYVKDDSQVKDITYTVKHYIEDEYQEKDDFEETVSVWVNDETAPVSYKVDENKYVGYKLSESNVKTEATDGEVFTVKYVKDDSQVKDITYTVKHYIEDEYQEKDDFEETVSVWVNDETAPVSYKVDENKYVGYKLSESDVKTEATDGEVFTVKYVKDDSQRKDITYTVKHYIEDEYQEKDDFKETVSVWVNDETAPVSYKVDENKYVGYKLSESNVKTEAKDGEVFTVKYVKDDTQRKDITYTVKHYIEDEYQEKDDFEETVSVWVNDETAPVSYKVDENKYVGYKLSESNVKTEAKDGEVFTVKYVKDDTQRKDITYTVKHYIEDEYQEKDDFEETVSVWVNDETAPVSYKVDENKYVGYKLSESDVKTEATDGEVFTVKYVKDDSQRKDITYTVKHYIEDEYQEKDDFKETVSVWVNDETAPVSYKVDENKYVGYKLSESNVKTEAKDGEVFTVKYVKDDSQVKDITYTVKHYIEDEYQEKDDFEETVSVWVNDETAPVSYKVDENKYVGYKLSESNVKTEAKDGEVFTVKYVKDDSQVKDITYTVKHYIEDEYQEKDDFEETVSVWVNDETAPVSYKVNENKYVGYKLSESDVKTEATDGEVFTVKYVKDDSQTKELSYTVEYYKNNILVEKDTQKVTKTVWINSNTLPVDVANINVTNKYVGYSFEKTNPETIPTEIEANGVIKVYYTINSYKLTVKYVYEDGKTAATTYTDELNYEEAYTVISPEITGYSADIKVVNGTMPADNVVVTVVYKINKYNYTINYYYESDASTATETYHNKTFILMDNETVEADFGTKVTSYDSSKLLQGYYEEGVEKLPLTVSEDETKNIVNVYFGKSPIDYVVNYYINDVKDNAKSYTGTSKVGNKITLQDVNKYAAEYVLDTEKTTVKENSPLVIKVIPSTGVNPNVIDVYYYTPADLEAKKVVKIGNKTLTDENTITVNSVITYEITVENKGGYASENVTLEDYVPAGTQLTEGQNLTTTTGEDGKTLITWDLGTIEGFGKRTVSFNVKVTGDALGETERNILTNIATAKTSSEEINSNPTNNVVVKPIQTKANVGTAVNIATNYIFVVDISYSMNDSLDRDSDDTIRYTPEENSRMAAMQSALNSFTSELFKTENDCTFTLVTFCNTASYVGTYNYGTKANLITAINNLTADSGTNIKAGLQEGNKHLQSSNNVVVLLSDGEPIGWGVEKNGSNIYRDCVKGKNASYYCIGFGKEANSPSKNAYKILDLIDDNTSNNTVKTSNSSSELIQNLTEVQYAEQDPQDVELETKQNNVFDLGGKELAADRNVTITYKDENGSNQTVSYTRQQIIDGGTPFTYDSTNKKLIFNVTNFVNCTDIIVEYYV